MPYVGSREHLAVFPACIAADTGNALPLRIVDQRVGLLPHVRLQ